MDKKKEENELTNIDIDSIKKGIDNIKVTAIKIVDRLSKVNWDNLGSRVNEGLKQGIKNIEELYKTLMLEAGYPPVANINFRQFSDVIKILNDAKDETERKEKLDKILFDIYNEDKCNSLIDKWSRITWLKKRIPILQEAMQAYQQDFYFSSVATFLPQIEGIFADGTDHTGDMKIRSKIKLILGNKNKKAFSFEEEVQEYYLNRVLDGFGHNEDNLPIFSRHAILHGADTVYGTKENCIKCIILFDFLSGKIDDFKKSKSDEEVHTD